MSQNVAIVDYGMGNLFSIKKRVESLGTNVIVASNAEDLNKADKIILPGVGHFAKAMENLRDRNLLETLNEAVLTRKKYVLGICLGMQLMARHSEEGDAEGLGWFDAEVVRFRIKDTLRFKVPHVGWNEVVMKRETPLLKDIPDKSEFYFVHSYYFLPGNPADEITATEYEVFFTSCIQKENIFGVQFHPEKSHDVGIKLFENFLNL